MFANFDAWFEAVTVLIRERGNKARMYRDHIASLIGAYWDGWTPEEAYNWLKRENCLIPA